MNKKELDPASSPAAALGVQLRRSREAKGLTQAGLGALVGYSATLTSYIERAERTADRAFAEKADDVLETGGTLQLMLLALHRSALLAGFPDYVDHEARATRIRVFEIGIVPGLLQAPGYAAAEAAGWVARGSVTQKQADERLALRLSRQRVLRRRPAPLVHAILDEASIRWSPDGPEVLAGQLAHLEALAALPHVVLQVLPFSLGARRTFHTPVTLLNLPGRARIGYAETVRRGYLERDPDVLDSWSRDFDRLQVDAPSVADSLAIIRAARRELHNGAPPAPACPAGT
ncbi:Scr1 family TA system antitoxin-like transcriptional regulator [Kitasatospora sp. NPDC058170]|uniref:helix-turn-helix domain-containing protein n=1 Tax=Kitasatospora sp. NPDC058170 TaxID=3346364 RepID=UPI0036DF3243